MKWIWQSMRQKMRDNFIKALLELAKKDKDVFLITGDLGFKIFDGGKVKRAIQAVQIQEDIASLNMAKLKQQLTQELANNYEIYTTRIAIFEINLKSFAAAKRNFEIARLRKNAGIINSFDLRNIEMVYLQTGTALFEAIFNIEESKTNLTRLTGGIIENKE